MLEQKVNTKSEIEPHHPSIAYQKASALVAAPPTAPAMNRAMLTRRSIYPCAVARPSMQTAANRAPAPSTSPRSANVVGGSKNPSDLHLLSSLAPVALLAAAADGAPRGLEKYFTNLLQGQADTFSALGLPDALVHWGHPGNMAGAFRKGKKASGFFFFPFFFPSATAQCQATRPQSHLQNRNASLETQQLDPPHPLHIVVLGAMGLYGCGYLGWSLRLSDDEAVVAKAKDLHPKLGECLFFPHFSLSSFFLPLFSQSLLLPLSVAFLETPTPQKK